jgi:stage II sporulation protein AA (anti-sigma F factor antagonist)
MDMQVQEAEGGIIRVVLEGRFDIAGAQEVDLRFSAPAGSAKTLVVDMAKVSFLASMGVRTDRLRRRLEQDVVDVLHAPAI